MDKMTVEEVVAAGELIPGFTVLKVSETCSSPGFVGVLVDVDHDCTEHPLLVSGGGVDGYPLWVYRHRHVEILDNLLEEWLGSLGSTLWGRGFNVKDEVDKVAAAAWFREQIKSYQKFLAKVEL